MLLEAYKGLVRFGAIIGRFGCLCNSEYPSPPLSLHGTQEGVLAALLSDFSSLRAQGCFPSATETPSSRPMSNITKSSTVGAAAPHPLIIKFDASFAKEACLECLMQNLDRLGGIHSKKRGWPECSDCALPLVDGAPDRTISEELVIIFRRIHQGISGQTYSGPSSWGIKSASGIAKQLQDLQVMYDCVIDLRLQLLRSHNFYLEGQADDWGTTAFD